MSRFSIESNFLTVFIFHIVFCFRKYLFKMFVYILRMSDATWLVSKHHFCHYWFWLYNCALYISYINTNLTNHAYINWIDLVYMSKFFLPVAPHLRWLCLYFFRIRMLQFVHGVLTVCRFANFLSTLKFNHFALAGSVKILRNGQMRQLGTLWYYFESIYSCICFANDILILSRISLFQHRYVDMQFLPSTYVIVHRSWFISLQVLSLRLNLISFPFFSKWCFNTLSKLEMSCIKDWWNNVLRWK